jgi:hypothetical protein
MTTTNQPNRPSHTLFMVEGDKDDATWTEIGVLWSHAKGGGFNLSLKALPMAREARLVILPRKARQQPQQEAGR